MNTAHPTQHEVTLGDNVRAERNRKRLTQTELGQKAGVTIGTIHNIESGKHTPSFDTLRRIAAALDCSLDILVPPVAA